jgi:general L-amino acid transport system substrate-binding protein
VLQEGARSEQERLGLREGVRRLLNLPTQAERSLPSLGAALGLSADFARQALSRLGNAAELWRRHFPGTTRSSDGAAPGMASLLAWPLGSPTPLAPASPIRSGSDRLEEIRTRGTLVVASDGVAEARGFSTPDPTGRLVGIDADLSRALAVALFGDPEAVRFRTDIPFGDTFAGVATGEVDLALRDTSATLSRDSALGVDFSIPYLLTGLMVLAQPNRGLHSLLDLGGARVGVMAETTAASVLVSSLQELGVEPRIKVVADLASLVAHFLAGDLDAISTDGALLAPLQEELARKGVASELLQQTLSEEVIAVVSPENQSALQDLVNSVIQILRTASVLGVTQSSVTADAIRARSADADPALKQLFGLGETSALSTLALTPERIEAIIANAGNLEQILNRHIDDITLTQATRQRIVERAL